MLASSRFYKRLPGKFPSLPQFVLEIKTRANKDVRVPNKCLLNIGCKASNWILCRLQELYRHRYLV